jgi:hypothetical protein
MTPTNADRVDGLELGRGLDTPHIPVNAGLAVGT